MPYTWRFDVVLENLPFLLAGLWRTCVLTLLAMMIGLILGLIVAIMRMAPWRLVSLPAAAFTELFRTTPLLVQIIWVFSVLPLTIGLTLSPFVSGLVALGCNVAAFMSEIYRAGISSVGLSQRHAAR